MEKRDETAGSRAWIGLGSNQGDRALHLRRALELLEAGGARVEAVSSWYRTEPVEAPGPWYLNAVARLRVPWGPRELLEHCQDVERALGRRTKGDRAPRSVDLDVLLVGERGEEVIREPGFEVPHPGMPHRRFVLVPLAELDPNLRVPGREATVEELRDSCAEAGCVKEWEGTDG